MPFARIGADGTFTVLGLEEKTLTDCIASIGTNKTECQLLVESSSTSMISIGSTSITCTTLVESLTIS